ncbi:transcriptional regulator [Synechococcus sp. PCC 7502]|uniref:TetR/AcrR family transcriptional regulator n=1 Tax=Synechococcus sp. PCC 7502 TaxID=1173263 RepID=UPI00029FA2B1|nr:TetR/AcrR family transcriptional regulator [Synechococcus sp. PCC 7502]AFY72776.1 transcriptional regulator [Synechococcus sp. PCC 7502]
MSRNTYIPCLLNLLCQYGYDGATLSKISEATGLGKASLYHHFPNGKDEMVTTVLNFLADWMEQNILPALKTEGSILIKMERMCDRLNEVYAGGEKPCLFAILLMGSSRDIFHDQVKVILLKWINEMTEVLSASGLDTAIARGKAEDVAIAIQGALILSHGLDDVSLFQRIIRQLPQRVCG